MTEERLRELHRQYLEDPADKWARYRYRLECVRMGRLEEAGLEVGDRIRVVESWPPAASEPYEAILWSLRGPRYAFVSPLAPMTRTTITYSPGSQIAISQSDFDGVTLLSPALPSES